MGRCATAVGCLLALGLSLGLAGIVSAQQEFSIEDLCRKNFQTGLEFLKNKRYIDAKESFISVVEACPENAEAHKMLGSVAISLQDFPQAIESYNRARKLLPGDVDMLESLAYAYSASAQTDEAEDLYLEVLEKDPSRFGAMQNLAFIYKRQGKMVPALMLDQRAVVMDADPEDFVPPEAIARDYLTQRVYPQALSLYRDRFAADSTDLASARMLAYFYYKIGHYEPAVSTYEAILEAEPESDTALREHQILADALKKLQKYDDAVVHMEYVMEKEPEEMNNYYNIAAIYNESNRYDKAMAVADRGLARNPSWGGLFYVKGEAYEGKANQALQAKQFEDAIAYYEQAKTTFQKAAGDQQFGGHAVKQVSRQDALIDRARKIRDKEETQ